MRYLKGIAILVLIFTQIGCGENKSGQSNFKLFKGDYLDQELFAEIIQKQIGKIDTNDSAFQYNLQNDEVFRVNYVYYLTGFQPIWIDDEGPKKLIDSFYNSLGGLVYDGLVVGGLMADIQQVKEYLNSKKSGIPIDSLIYYDHKLTQCYLNISKELLLGSSFLDVDNQWFVQNDTLFYAPEYLSYLALDKKSTISWDTFRSKVPEYEMIRRELKIILSNNDSTAQLNIQNLTKDSPDSIWIQILASHLDRNILEETDTSKLLKELISSFQKKYQLSSTGKKEESIIKLLKRNNEDKKWILLANIERLKQLPRFLGDEYIWVNIPLMELQYVRGKSKVFESKVVVGKLARPTPSISSPLTNIVFNPPWGVPPTILRNDVVPGVARAGGSYLARKGLRAYDRKGRDVTSSVNASNIKNFAIRQPPGARNALGDIKFNMPNKEAIYIHDTPDRGVFKASNRALSSGCVRTENPKELAEIILNNKELSISAINNIIQTRTTRSEELKNPIPSYIIYLTVALDSDGKKIQYLRDIYGRDEKMKKKLKAL